MSTLFNALLSQHSRSLNPVRHTEQMTAQLQSFFEEVVLENDLQAIVIECLPPRENRSLREIDRVRRIGEMAQNSFFLVDSDDELNSRFAENSNERLPVILPHQWDSQQSERFVVIADAHFSAVLTAIDLNDSPNDSRDENAGQQVIYSFEPDVVYTALEYLQARFAAQFPNHSDKFAKALTQSMPKATSLRLTLSVTNKLANLWQKQTGRELAVNRISTAIRQSLELDQVLQTAVNEVGLALSLKNCALLVSAEDNDAMSVTYFREGISENDGITIQSDLEAYQKWLRNNPRPFIRDGLAAQDDNVQDKPFVVVPLAFLEQFVGVLFVQADSASRVWQESEVLLIQTVADQVTIAIKHARLYVKSQLEALRDCLTGIFNRRFFEMQLEKEFKISERNELPLSVIMIDLDKFKSINDNFGHSIGDRVLKLTANVLKGKLRVFDTLARYGGEEFIVILPQTNLEGACLVAERLRHALETTEMPEVKKVTASLGVASFPEVTDSMKDLVEFADQALYRAKTSGRNRVCVSSQNAKVSVN
ncbi:MAG: sensor domain-containing diguanylate cyclase [Pyrinomonadaceae bacterium]|nr:sensor domain-containing diguanylate cyclase [Pyrinomonadaceae bacterium]